ncbi:hypothetical protein ACFO7V_01675 [Glutamicibacter bergerei]|uniref:Uncharacterized protein n=1 Tax=Glutamicibacter bergerei TaxID=256702 RepID=A0ABV9MG60_9MICC|nr:hypothetical protein [Micrococcaceae bacterium]
MSKKNTPRIFEMFPSQNYWDSVVHFAHLDLDAIELGYAEAAKRIANSVSGKEAYDDLVLIPFMFLWRHAIELSLKNQIREALTLKSWTDATGATADLQRLTPILNSKHNLKVLFDELQDLFAWHNLDKFPDEARKTLVWLADSDPTGQAFRYAGSADNDQSHVDFPGLSTGLESTYRLISAGADILGELAGYLEDELEEERYAAAEARAEFMAELEAESNDELMTEIQSEPEG